MKTMIQLIFVLYSTFSILPFMDFLAKANADFYHTKDFCTMEFFNLSCSIGDDSYGNGSIPGDIQQVLLIKKASFGRMQMGKCVRESLGYLGCSDDVTKVIDARCAGRPGCSFMVPDPILFAFNACNKEVTRYLRVEFKCVPVISKEQSNCYTPESIQVSATPLYLSNYFNHMPTGSQTAPSGKVKSHRDQIPNRHQPCVFILEVNPGLQINITLLNFFEHKDFQYNSSAGDLQSPAFPYMPHSPGLSSDSHKSLAFSLADNGVEAQLQQQQHVVSRKRRKRDTFKSSPGINDSLPASTLEKPLNSSGHNYKQENSLSFDQTNLSNFRHLKVANDTDSNITSLQQQHHYQEPQQHHHQEQQQHHHQEEHDLFQPLIRTSQRSQRARICIEIAYISEVPSDKTSSNPTTSKWKRDATEQRRGRTEILNSGETVPKREYSVPHSNGDKIVQDHKRYNSDTSIKKLSKRQSSVSPYDRRSISICADDPRAMQVFVSKSSRIRVELRDQSKSFRARQGMFMLQFQATGCRNPDPIPDAGVHRHGNSLSITCNHSSDVTYHMTCRNGKWVGHVGNCSIHGKSIMKLNQKSNKEDYFPFGILVMVVVGVAIGIVVGGMFLCLVVACTKNCSAPTNPHMAAEYQSILVNNSSNNCVSSTTTAGSNNVKFSETVQKQHVNAARSNTPNWSRSTADYYPSHNPQSSLSLSDYSCFRGAPCHDAFQQQQLVSGKFQYNQPEQPIYSTKCCVFNPEEAYAATTTSESSLTVVDAMNNVTCQKLVSNLSAADVFSPANYKTTSVFSTPTQNIKIVSQTLKTPTSPLAKNFPSSALNSFGNSTKISPVDKNNFYQHHQQCCITCRNVSENGTLYEVNCNCCGNLKDVDHFSTFDCKQPALFAPMPFQYNNPEMLKPDLTQVNN